MALAGEDPRVNGLRFSRNFGQHSAIAAGIDHATGERIVVMDSDLQDPPAVIADLWRKAAEGFDIVFVDRVRRPESAVYLATTRVFYSIFNALAGQALNRDRGNFSIISRDVADAYRKLPDRDRFYAGTLAWLGFRETSIEAQHDVRFAGKSAYSLAGRLRLARRIIVGSSTRLLYLAIIFGTCMAALSFLLGAKIVIQKILNPSYPLPGWPSVMTAVLFAAGLTNIMLGLIGIYIAELVDWAKRRPSYVIRQVAGGRLETIAEIAETKTERPPRRQPAA